jgi:hypothetical protein
MATRSSGISSRSSKKAARTMPPVTTVTEEEQKHVDADAADADSVESLAADGVVGEVPQQNIQITNSNITRAKPREIPSFSESREARIAESAYWRAERRGFAAGHELEDWLHAEKEVDGDQSK